MTEIDSLTITLSSLKASRGAKRPGNNGYFNNEVNIRLHVVIRSLSLRERPSRGRFKLQHCYGDGEAPEKWEREVAQAHSRARHVSGGTTTAKWRSVRARAEYSGKCSRIKETEKCSFACVEKT